MKIVVFGASGFVGGWICEEMLREGNFEIRACVRRWAASARVARRGIEIFQVDLDGNEDWTPVLAGADAVINATVMSSDREPDLALKLYQACGTVGVSRFVQFSSIAVYGDRTGDVTEDMLPSPIDDYGRGKAKMEKRLLEAAALGGPSLVILRPSIIYGPFSDQWTVRYTQRIVGGRWRNLGWHGTGTCNLVHAHDVARSAILAATTDVGSVPLVLNINGPDTVSWNEYIEKLGDSLHVSGRKTPNAARMSLMVYGSKAVRFVGKWMLTNFRDLIRSAAQSGKTGPAVMAGVKAMADLYPTPGEMSLLRRRATYLWDRAETKLGFRPSVSLEEGLRQTSNWSRKHGIAPLEET